MPNENDWPRGHRKRLRNRYTHGGFAALTQVEKVELILGPSRPHIDLREVAVALLERFGSLEGILEAGYEDLQQVNGVGEAVAFHIALTLPLSREYARLQQTAKPILRNTEQTIAYVQTLEVSQDNETLWLMLTNAHFQLKRCIKLHEGTLTAVHFAPGTIVKHAIRHGAAHVFLVHSHTVETASPSPSDIQATAVVAEALKSVDINLVDHIIIARAGHFSFYQNNMLHGTTPALLQKAAAPAIPFRLFDTP